MKLIQILSIAIGLAFVAPSASFAQPAPHHNGPSMHQNNKNKNKHNNGYRHDDRDDRRDHHNGPAVPPPPVVHHPGPAVPPPPAPVVHHSAPVHHGTTVKHTVYVHPAPAPVIVNHHNPHTHGMASHEFDSLVRHVNRSHFRADKVSLIHDAARHNYFTSHQVKKLIRAIDFEGDRITVACALYPRVVDPQAWHSVLNEFSHHSRSEVMRCSR